MTNSLSHEECDDPLYADRRNFYKVEKWSEGRAASFAVEALIRQPIRVLAGV
jgi:hypothetical protein